MKPAVLDASPVIILARAGSIDVLPRLLAPVLIPLAVADEILAGPADDPARRLLGQAPDWLSIVPPERAVSGHLSVASRSPIVSGC